ncbi:transcription-repair coupling factor [Terrimicrobium sacchariphilum]|nr:transcription-repair coupling factor [Terrimicrobium sacchariphilum]
MKKSSALDRIIQCVEPVLKGRLSRPGALSEVCESAQPFVASMVIRAQANRRVWVECPTLKAQEAFAAELAVWNAATRIFPELEAPADENDTVLADPETAAERLELLQLLGGKDYRGPVVVHTEQWTHHVPTSQSIAGAVLRLERDRTLSLDEATEKLAAAGYERTAQVGTRGQYAVRGGIFDVYSWQAPLPFRVELDDDRIESIREFHPDTQISISTLEDCEILAGNLDRRLCLLENYVGKDDLIISSGPVGRGEIVLEAGGANDPAAFFPQPFSEFHAGDLVLDAARRGQFFRQLEEWRREGWMVALLANSDGEIERFRELAREHCHDVADLVFLKLPLSRGFICPAVRLAVLSDAELFGRGAALRLQRLALRRERAVASRAATDFSEFAPGDYVVHLDHGIGRFEGLQERPGTGEGEMLVVEYANSARLYVPLDQAWQVSRYVGLGKKNPELSELGDAKWEKAKQKAQKSIFDYAASMLRIQAEREIAPGFAHPPDSHWQEEFEDSFPYKATVDQVRAIAEAKHDMESDMPMDRLVCGDVGFGKTEVAIRAVFKAVMSGKQVAVLAPTTVLAQQHYQNFRERMSDYPVNVELLSRYRTPAEQKKVLRGLAAGGVDIVVGTHRLVSADVQFKDIGLVVVDEEQRFGVKHKDRLKERFRQVDVLTLSATPIPRTLYLALMGARDMSVIETPPANRQSVETIVCAYDERVFRDAINRELNRGGQVYFLHNRVGTIEKVAARIKELCPKAKVIVGHGQMAEGALEDVMRIFVGGKADVLVSTTIIESGIDIPNANTIIIDRADLFGLADLYQLRGRVGRSQNKAYAYLMLPRDLMGAARKRVSAIKQYSELGSGFKIAMRDLEIRGAGNLLGTAQSGHIITVGFDLYCKLLKQAVDTLKGNRRGKRPPAGLRLDFVTTDEAQWISPGVEMAGSFLPASYVTDSRTRIVCYRKLAEVSEADGVGLLENEWRDRFGPLPLPAENALLCARIRIEAARRRITMVESRDSKLMLTQRRELLQKDGRFPRLTASDPDSRLREILSFLESIPCT